MLVKSFSKILSFTSILFLLFITSITLNAAEPFGDRNAVKGGRLVLHTNNFPKSFNYLVNNAADAAEVFELVYDSLMELDPVTLEYKSLIAKSWVVSSDKKTFTITIDPRAKWADGKLITTDDIKFTYDTIMNPKNLTSVSRLFIGRFNTPEVVNKSTIKFTAKNVHYNNLVNLASFNVLPKHLFEGKDFNKAFTTSLPAGSGPYTLTEVKDGRYYELTRKKDYWADQLSHRRGTYNFDKIRYKVMSADTAFEAFKKGDFDIFDVITPKRWVTETGSDHFKKNWVAKQKVYNYAPRGISGLSLNMRNPLFKDIKVRKALAHLLDRDYIIKKILFNQVQPLTSYWPSLYGSGSANYAITYQPETAKKLLSEVGYSRLNKNGYLINKNNQQLEFSIMYANEESELFLTNYVDTCKKAGVKVSLQRMSWATMIKKMDEFKFDSVLIGWTGTLFDDPEQLWHSKHINENGSSNLSGYKNDKVDKLINSLPPIYDASKRVSVIKQIDSVIYNDVPYVLFWGRPFNWVFYKNVFGQPKTVYPKYSGGSLKYWWFDPVKVKNYEEAVKSGKTLPKVPEEIRYDKLAR